MKKLGCTMAAGTSLAVLLLSGCRIENHKNGKNDDVNIGTPFGSMQVKTNDNVNSASLGITQYPGSSPLKNDHDNDSADVNMSFGGFHLGVKAASFLTTDGQDKVMAFYRKDLKRYGEVIECRGKSPVGQPERTSQGLTCGDGEGDRHVKISSHSDSDLELKTGSRQQQHIVALEHKDGGTKIGLVALELPSQIHAHGDKDIE